MFAALGRAVVHHPWWVIIGWIVGAAAVIALSPALVSAETAAVGDGTA